MACSRTMPPAPSCAAMSARNCTSSSSVATGVPRTATPAGKGFNTCHPPTPAMSTHSTSNPRRQRRLGLNRVTEGEVFWRASGAAIANEAGFVREARERRAAGAGLARQHRAQVFGRARVAEQASLCEVAARLTQELQLALGLHALGDHVHAE